MTVPDTLHRRLRRATAGAHTDLETALGWETRVATAAGYRDLLGRFRGFHAAYEPAIARALSDDAFFAPRRRLGLLDADLRHLGLVAVGALPRPEPIPIADAAAATGSLYVLEGSTLGGQVIGRHIAAVHGLGPDGLLYYGGYGARTGAMWAAFRARLEAYSGDPVAEVALTAAAIATFEAMRLWLCAETRDRERA